MSVKLISITKGVGELKAFTTEGLITHAARVSNPNNQMNMDTAPKLIKYLVKHKHFSPLEMVSMCVEVQTSRAICARF